MNKVILMGRLTDAPKVTVSANGETKIARFTLAVNRIKEGADFISCVCFGKQADFSETYLNKGTKVCICGRIQTGKYTNKDGRTVYTTDVALENIEFAESKASQNNVSTPNNDFISVPDNVVEELPFN